jgi:hypothetical protein
MQATEVKKTFLGRRIMLKDKNLDQTMAAIKTVLKIRTANIYFTFSKSIRAILHTSLALGWFIYFTDKALQMHCSSDEDYLLTDFSRKIPKTRNLKNLFFIKYFQEPSFNTLTPELNLSAQRFLTRFFCCGFCFFEPCISLILA